MSCSDEGGFGYVEVEKDRLKVVDGDPSNPTIKYFCSCEIVNRYNEYENLKRSAEYWNKECISIIEKYKEEKTLLGIKNMAEKRLKQLKINLLNCGKDSVSAQIIESNIRVCEAILAGEQ